MRKGRRRWDIPLSAFRIRCSSFVVIFPFPPPPASAIPRAPARRCARTRTPARRFGRRWCRPCAAARPRVRRRRRWRSFRLASGGSLDSAARRRRRPPDAPARRRIGHETARSAPAGGWRRRCAECGQCGLVAGNRRAQVDLRRTPQLVLDRPGRPGVYGELGSGLRHGAQVGLQRGTAGGKKHDQGEGHRPRAAQSPSGQS